MYPSFDLFVYTLLGELSTKSDSKNIAKPGERYTWGIHLSISETASHPSREWTLTPVNRPTNPSTWVLPKVYLSLGKTTVSEEQSKNLQWDDLSTTINYSAHWTENPTSILLRLGNRTMTSFYPCAAKEYCCHKPDRYLLQSVRIWLVACLGGLRLC